MILPDQEFTRQLEDMRDNDPKALQREKSKAFRALKEHDRVRETIIEMLRDWASEVCPSADTSWPAAPNIVAPWGALWEHEQGYEVRPCKWVGNRPAIWRPHKPGIGKPIFRVPLKEEPLRLQSDAGFSHRLGQ